MAAAAHARYDLRTTTARLDLFRPARPKRGVTDTLFRLEATIAQRRVADPATSYVASLMAKGRAKIAQKLGEEAVETVIAATSSDAKALTGEAADLLFHLLIALGDAGVPLNDVLAELERREGTSGLDEKAARSS